ncbi:proteasome subunit alpha type [Gregarina niphandrodes]|uniref:Proteasome subunit alpha type n=1 Tax=Gregarina niphandrodes TaxID=110365 RepID=A0A023B6Z2_GRENI|nr:proteasome subunit alpha type [Gregarina niphandrodes]EZG66838.1 proteasome subunit alpha type [Gregarina niphandrodes]|eukprot:XP_011130460.1 proteasome subunit alpha type [Gregarina niphandrodes]
MSRSSASYYDRQITVFSPEGKLFQVEYAFRAVEAANITVVALRGKEAAVIVGQKKASSQALAQDKLLDASSLSSMYFVTPKVGGAFVGMPADCRSMVYRARQKASNFSFDNGFEIPIHHLAYKIAQINQVFTQHAYMRLHACVGILIGIDEETRAPKIFKFDPAGWFTGNKAAVVGNKEAEATNLLQKLIKDKEPDTLDETVMGALATLQQTLGMDMKAADLEISYVTVDNPNFRLMAEADVDRYLTMVAERD